MAYIPDESEQKALYPSQDKALENASFKYEEYFVMRPSNYVHDMSILSFLCSTEIIPHEVREEMAVKAVFNSLHGILENPNAHYVEFDKISPAGSEFRDNWNIPNMSKYSEIRKGIGVRDNEIVQSLIDRGLIGLNDIQPDKLQQQIEENGADLKNDSKDRIDAAIGHRISMTMAALGFGPDSIDPLFKELKKRYPQYANAFKANGRVSYIVDAIKKSKWHYMMDEFRTEATKQLAANGGQLAEEYNKKRKSENAKKGSSLDKYADLRDVSPFIFEEIGDGSGRTYAELFQENFNREREKAGDISNTKFVDDINVFVNALNNTTRVYRENTGKNPEFNNVAFFNYFARQKNEIDPEVYSVKDSSSQYWETKDGRVISGKKHGSDIGMKTHSPNSTHYSNDKHRKAMQLSGLKPSQNSFGSNYDGKEEVGMVMEDNGVSEDSISRLQENYKK